MPSRKSSKLSRRHRNRKARTVKRRKSHSRRLRGGSGGSNNLLMRTPWPGSPYDAAAADLPVGKYLPLSNVGIPSGAMNVPEPSNSQFGLQFGGGHPRNPRYRGKHSGKKYRSRRSGRRGARGRAPSRRGRSISGRSRSMRGGGLSAFMSTIFPDDAVNAVRSVPAAFGHLSDKFNGLISSPSSLVYPTEQPYARELQDTKIITPPNIRAIYTDAAARVQGM